MNREDPTNLWGPWGYMVGHQTEWAKLLIMLERHRPLPWLIPQARKLFDSSLEIAWDRDGGGIHYTFAPLREKGSIVDSNRFFWVHAETLAAAAVLGARTGEDKYWDWYDKIFGYCWDHFIDHTHGAWYWKLNPEGTCLGDDKAGLMGIKCDYHTIGACAEAIHALRLRRTDPLPGAS
eukprot:NODE_6036_length_885_cov_99.960630_g5807_i0.p1 GENE.NODE_6036_length_885_cov_99.960630_g5807_i0~~NODE_6036_length_885_cov_99.960630_g5807_i0.p1  ORF type:complete len:178 (+),score=21.40 NODE_6036_length_885_cov_99.960630_g5807_i0:309-842(+)